MHNIGEGRYKGRHSKKWVKKLSTTLLRNIQKSSAPNSPKSKCSLLHLLQFAPISKTLSDRCFLARPAYSGEDILSPATHLPVSSNPLVIHPCNCLKLNSWALHHHPVLWIRSPSPVATANEDCPIFQTLPAILLLLHTAQTAKLWQWPTYLH